jgi:hypothetical protein
MDTKIVSAFPATGKSYLFAKSKKKIMDSDSSHFSWVHKGVRHPNFPQNYIDHIKENIGKVDIILVSSHKVVRDALVKNKLDFILAYPSFEQKEEYIRRCEQRGSDEKFILMLEEKWEEFLSECVTQENCKQIILSDGQYLSDWF